MLGISVDTLLLDEVDSAHIHEAEVNIPRDEVDFEPACYGAHMGTANRTSEA